MIISVIVGVLIPLGVRVANGCDGSSEVARVGAGSTVRWVLQSSGRGLFGQPGAGVAGRMVSRSRAARACSASAVNGPVAAGCSHRRGPVRAWRAGDREQPQAQPFGFPAAALVAGQGEGLPSW